LPELQKLKNPVAIESLHIHKTELSLEDPDTHVTGKLNYYLSVVAPSHTGQAKSFADSLFATLSKRGRRTDPPADFADLVATRGYTKSEFMAAVETLRATPDQQALVNTWLAYLKDEQMPILEFIRLQLKLTQMLESHLQVGEGVSTPLAEAAKEWVSANPPNGSALAFVRAGAVALSVQFPAISLDRLQAQIVLEGINLCLSQT
jgi:hypothetical protein